LLEREGEDYLCKQSKGKEGIIVRGMVMVKSEEKAKGEEKCIWLGVNSMRSPCREIVSKMISVRFSYVR
jgi:hypothetical protein